MEHAQIAHGTPAAEARQNAHGRLDAAHLSEDMDGVHPDLVESSVMSTLQRAGMEPPPKPVGWVYNPDGSVLMDHRGRPVSVDRILMSRPLRGEISQRPGPGGKKLSYISGDDIIRTLNDVFGFDGWNLDIKKVQREECKKDDRGRHTVVYTALVRLTHKKSGAYKEDFGAGDSTDKTFGTAVEHALKSSITDAMKRCARHFGEKLGNALYHGNFKVNQAPMTLKDALDKQEIERANSKFGFPKDSQGSSTAVTTTSPSPPQSNNRTPSNPPHRAQSNPTTSVLPQQQHRSVAIQQSSNLSNANPPPRVLPAPPQQQFHPPAGNVQRNLQHTHTKQAAPSSNPNRHGANIQSISGTVQPPPRSLAQPPQQTRMHPPTSNNQRTMQQVHVKPPGGPSNPNRNVVNTSSTHSGSSRQETYAMSNGNQGMNQEHPMYSPSPDSFPPPNVRQGLNLSRTVQPAQNSSNCIPRNQHGNPLPVCVQSHTRENHQRTSAGAMPPKTATESLMNSSLFQDSELAPDRPCTSTGRPISSSGRRSIGDGMLIQSVPQVTPLSTNGKRPPLANVHNFDPTPAKKQGINPYTAHRNT